MNKFKFARRTATFGFALFGASSLLAEDTPSRVVILDQGVSSDILDLYHYTDQGSRMAPAAWLSVLESPDGSGRLMSSENMRKFGFIVDGVTINDYNPYGWPIGFVVSQPSASDGIPSAGPTCAACHTGQINYKGTAIRIEGGQGMHDADSYFAAVGQAFVDISNDPERLEKFLADAVAAGYPADRIEADFEAKLPSFTSLSTIKAQADNGLFIGRGRSDAIGGLANGLMVTAIKVPSNKLPPDAPVSVPYLWDIWRLSWVQTNGFEPGSDALGRNVGEVLGVFGETNIVDKTTGNLNPEPLRWKTSIQLDGLLFMENALRGLKGPMWPEDVLGPLDVPRVEQGRALFEANCVSCHGIKELPDGTWDVTVPSLDLIGTDPKMAVNWAARTYDVTKLGLGENTTVPDALPIVVREVKTQLYDLANTPESAREPAYSHEAPCGYKARPLIGTWATPPFLHNGSVRTLFDLLSETRPDKFNVGSIEFDPLNVGYTDDPSTAQYVFDASIPGNFNLGHWFTDDQGRKGRIGPALSDAEKYALIEYLKSANYEDYPTENRDVAAMMACQDDREWAMEK